MRATRRRAELIGRLYADLPRDPQAPTPVGLDGETAEVVRAVAAAERASVGGTPEPDVQERVWRRVLAEAAQSANTRPSYRPRHAPRLGIPAVFRHWLSAAAIVTLLVLGGGLWASPGARAGAARLACLIPGLGIRDCAAPGLVASGPVATTRGAMTLTVTHLLSTGGQTTVRLEITGLTFEGEPPGMNAVRVSARDERGKAYARADTLGAGAIRSGGAVGSLDGTGMRFVREETLAPLDSDVRAVELLVDGPVPIGSWRVRVPLLPVGEAPLRAATPGAGGVAREGITLRVAAVAAGGDGLAVQLTAQLDPTVGAVREIGGPRGLRRLVLRDDRGREYAERPQTTAQAPADAPGVTAADTLFALPPLDAGAASLTVPFVTVEEAGGAATLRVPLAGYRTGDRIPLAAEIAIGQYRFRVVEATLAEDNKGEPRLWLTLDLGDWAGGRKLVSPGRVAVGDDEGAWRGASACGGDVGQCARLAVALPRRAGDEVTITFRNPIVAIQGPWELDVPLPTGR